MQKVVLIVFIILGFKLTILAQGVKIGNNSNVADVSAILDVESTTKGVLHPRMTEVQRDSIVSPAIGLLIFQIDGIVGFYYWTGGCWQMMCDPSPCGSYAIGDTGPGGGIVFYLAPNNTTDLNGDGIYDIGLECAPLDQGFVPWGCFGTNINGADGTSIGTGAQNTLEILLGCSDSGIAADICANLILGGYSDWFLPSKDELNQMYLNKSLIGGFANAFYWSSSELDYNDAWRQTFSYGSQTNYFRFTSWHVRAIRAF